MKIHPLVVLPNVPPALRPLQEIAMNMWFCWNWEAVELFIRLDPIEWEASRQNPIALLGRLPQVRLQEMAADESFVAMVERVYRHFQAYLHEPGWFQREHPDGNNMLVAYFSCEYGIDQGLPIYSGGLGVLSGDHLKTASDLGIPLIGVGLLYRQGYFQQRLSADGWQQEEYPENDWHRMPVEVVTRDDGQPVQFPVRIGERDVAVQLWRVRVGRTSLYLLDTNLPQNAPADREITMQLYGGDREMRLRQEILLGMGGCKALQEIGLHPTVYHSNEGHSAFQILARLQLLLDQGLTVAEAREVIWASTVFTTHTPVPAGNERFEPHLLQRYLEPAVRRAGWSWDEFLALGRENPRDHLEHFCMTVFALHFAAYANAVSALHGTTTRNMWHVLWKEIPQAEVPITHITNGVHTPSWLSHDMAELYTRYFGPRFITEPARFEFWERIDRIPDAELWRTHERRRERLVFFARKQLRNQLMRTGASKAALLAAEEVLDPDVLTVGFARRFATYKRGTMIFQDVERLARLIHDERHPVQFIFSGKAHPQDIPGKQLIKEIIHQSRVNGFGHRIVFLENYDINVGRYLIQGCDVWLNTPRRPLEASGTSGMKVAANGGLNVSVLDGWWCEGYQPGLGWAIGTGEEYADEVEADRVESAGLYNLLEQEIIPAFYTRDRTGLPREWIQKMKNAIRTLGPQFSCHRMLTEYTRLFYRPAHHFNERLAAEDFAAARGLAAWRQLTRRKWPQITIVGLGVRQATDTLRSGDHLAVEVSVQLGELTPKDVAVEILFGRIDARDTFVDPAIVPAALIQDPARGDGIAAYRAECVCEWSGRYGFAARVRAQHADLVHAYNTGMVTWERE